MKALIAAHPNVKFIFKELPIFGPSSVYAAKMSVAAFESNKFEAFHNALFDTGLMEGKLTPAAVDQVAQKAGINLKQAKVMMQGLSVSGELSRNQYLAQQLEIGGTPDFVVMPNSVTPAISKITFLPGAVHQQALEQAITQAGS
jgi:protein-disulfide isomerase